MCSIKHYMFHILSFYREREREKSCLSISKMCFYNMTQMDRYTLKWLPFVGIFHLSRVQGVLIASNLLSLYIWLSRIFHYTK